MFGVAGTYNQRLGRNNPTKTSWPELVDAQHVLVDALKCNELVKMISLLTFVSCDLLYEHVVFMWISHQCSLSHPLILNYI